MSKVKISVVDGVEGTSLYVEDASGNGGTRVAGNKPWGGGETIHTFTCDYERLVQILKDQKTND